MLLKVHDITIAVTQKGKDKLSCSVFRRTHRVFRQDMPLDEWDGDNDLAAYLNNNGMGELWEQVRQQNTDDIGSILASVTDVFDYGVKSGMDIHFGDLVFRLDKDGYISSKAFQIWYLATMKRIPVIKEKEWEEFVASCLSISQHKMYDPLAPELIDSLISLLKQGEIHSDFCDTLAREVSANASGTYFVYRKDENFRLYVPKHICESIRKQNDIGTKKARQYWEPFLDPMIEDNPRVGLTIPTQERPRKRFWVFSMEKLVDYDSTIAGILDDVIDCSKEQEVEVNAGK
ncbi:MAG: hypothetical protein M1285_05545 [Candidatus Thermoplasmatota archaeon]|nr:hypothetical protein [Candidatus Thermoplasmatota archaeon]